MHAAGISSALREKLKVKVNRLGCAKSCAHAHISESQRQGCFLKKLKHAHAQIRTRGDFIVALAPGIGELADPTVLVVASGGGLWRPPEFREKLC